MRGDVGVKARRSQKRGSGGELLLKLSDRAMDVFETERLLHHRSALEPLRQGGLPKPRRKDKRNSTLHENVCNRKRLLTMQIDVEHSDIKRDAFRTL